MDNALKKNDTAAEIWRPNVGIMIINSDKKILMGRRRTKRPLQFPYQMPQGGIDEGENPEQAMWRECKEETGLTQETCHLIYESKNWYTYRLARTSSLRRLKGFVGQRQRWFLLQFLGQESDIHLVNPFGYPEFSDYKWVPLDEIAQLVVPFKRSTYLKVVSEFKSVINAL